MPESQPRLPALLLMLLLALPLSLQAQSAVPTTLERVTQSAWQHFPGIIAAQALINEREAERIQAQGAFDTQVEVNTKSRLNGYYDNRSLQASVTQPLTAMGSAWFMDYSLSDGRFPIYEQQLRTGNLGELRMGVVVSPLRDRDIDLRRAGLAAANLDIDIAELSLTEKRIEVLQQAYLSWARWVVAARLASAYEGLLVMAEERGSAIQRQVEAGEQAELLAVENRQAILQRQTLVADARRQQAIAAQALSFYFRDQEGQPQLPHYDDSLALPESEARYLQQTPATLISEALERRPDVAIMRLLQSQLNLQRSLAENEAKPQLDLRLYGTRDLGNGPESSLGIDSVADLRFSVPLQNRKARGQIAATDARLHGLRQDLRLLQEQTRLSLQQALINLETARELLALSSEEAEVAATLAEAEQRRFDAGISDFFLLNVRENALAEAQLRRWQADLNHQLALAQVYGLSVDIDALGGPDDGV